MARLNLLSDIEILNAPRRAANYMLGDGGNLHLRILAGVFADKRDGTRVKLVLGPYPDVRTKEAPNRAADLRKLVDAGVDPVRKRAEDEADRRTTVLEPETVAEAFEDWKIRRLSARKDGGKEVERMFKKEVISSIGSLPMKSVRRRDIVSILDTVHARGSKRMSGQLLNELRLFMNHAVDREWIEATLAPNKQHRSILLTGRTAT